MAITKVLDTKGAKKQILPKGTGQAFCLKMKIAYLGVELWSFPNEKTKPYAQLTFECDVGEEKQGAVTLNWQECYAVSGAIREWLSSLESGIEEHHELALHMELASLTVDFYRQGVVQGPKMICTVESEDGLSRQAVLTHSEASLLGWLLYWQGEDEAEQ